MDDPVGTKIYGKKDTALSYTIPHSGSGSFSATGLPSGLTFINAATGVISGSTSVTGTQNFTVTATGTTAGGGTVTVSKEYTLVITDPTSFPYRMDLTLDGYTGSSTLTDFPVLVEFNSSISGFSYNGFLDPDGDGVPTGSDLRFFASNGKELPYEIAEWNPSIKLQANDITALDLWLDASDTTKVVIFSIAPMQYPNGVTKVAKVTTQPSPQNHPNQVRIHLLRMV